VYDYRTITLLSMFFNGLNGIEVDMKRLMIKIGIHGKRHIVRHARILEWMHNNGLGV